MKSSEPDLYNLIFFYLHIFGIFHVNKRHQNFDKMCVITCLCLALDATKMRNPPLRRKGASCLHL